MIGAPIDATDPPPHDATRAPDTYVPPDACVDSDNDGVCDTEEWPCGALPVQPATELDMYANGTKTHFKITQIAVGTNQRWVGAPGTSIDGSLHYEITDTACSQACVDQLEIGWVAGTRSGCLFDQTVSPSQDDSATASVALTLPAVAGAYDIRLNIGQNLSCTHDGAHDWWNGQPDDTRTITRVCVH